MTITTGTRFGAYEITALLGADGMGGLPCVLYYAHHDRLLDNIRGEARFRALLDRARVEWES